MVVVNPNAEHLKALDTVNAGFMSQTDEQVPEPFSSPSFQPSPTAPEFLNQILRITLASIIVVASFVLICKKWMKKENQQR
jgi:hypothetical protein